MGNSRSKAVILLVLSEYLEKHLLKEANFLIFAAGSHRFTNSRKMETEEKLQMFANRLRKVNRHISKWARKRELTCFRIYDSDIPEFPLAIDRYDQIIHIAEYSREHGMDEQAHSDWLAQCLEVVAEVLDVHTSRIYLKYRQRQKGLQQYERFARIGTEYIVRENGLKFIINPSDYLDTGLFLDHRNTRQMVREMSQGKRVLNLFAYTGSFSVYAAAGGASETLTVDMSATYLNWALRNMEINQFDGEEHRFLQADVLQWLEVPEDAQWDLVVVDPPTFSNSKRMKSILDIQRDHVHILNRVLERTNPGGTVVFSTNHRKFKLQEEAIQSDQIKNISGTTVPEDFRNKRIHQCFLIGKK